MRRPIITIAVVILTAGTVSAVTLGKTIHVDADAAGANNGTSWENAYKFLQDALTDANSSEKPVEIRVAQGVYQPDRSSAEPNGTRDREATFQLISGVALKGGYAGFGQPEPNVRDIALYETILSGDLDGNDVDVDSALDLWHDPGRAENSYHVVTASGTDETAVLDGFTITGGNADGSILAANDRGGGMYISHADPTIIACAFTKNSASYTGGGGIYSYQSTPTIRGSTFKTNVASRAGGGMFNTFGRPKLAECIFVDNAAYPPSTSGLVLPHYGGGLYNVASNLTLTNCTLHTNYALYSGGGIYSIASDLSLTNCLVIGNSAFYGGGAASLSDEGSVKCINCTLAGNRAHLGSPLNVFYTASEYTIEAINCILWDGGKEIGTQDSNNVLVSYSVIQGGWPGEGNVDADPCFAEPGYWTDPCNTPNNLWDDGWTDGDWHVKSQAGRWYANEGRWVIDDVSSPCIDAGDPMTPIGLEPFPNGGIINMGAYGGTVEASKSYFGEPMCETIVVGDVNGDCKVNFLDFRLMALHWLEER